MTKRATVLACLVLLAACSDLREREVYLNTLVGQPETELVRRMGVPNRSFEVQGRKFLAYSEHQVVAYRGGPFVGPWGGPYGPYGFAGRVVDWPCETTFELVGGRVQSWSLRGDGCG